MYEVMLKIGIAISIIGFIFGRRLGKRFGPIFGAFYYIVCVMLAIFFAYPKILQFAIFYLQEIRNLAIISGFVFLLSKTFLELMKTKSRDKGFQEYIRESAKKKYRQRTGQDVSMKGDVNAVAVIAVYNEEKILQEVLQQIKIPIILIDDGSTDETAKIGKEMATHFLQHEFTLGQGAALKTGFEIALEKGYNVIVEMDGDGQHNPKDIPRFLEAFEETDLVVSRRDAKTKMQAYRKYGNIAIAMTMRFLTRYKLKDPLCGFRLFSGKTMAKILPYLEENQYVAVQMLLGAHMEKIRIKEIPIHASVRKHGKSKKGAIRYVCGILWAAFKILHRKGNI